MAKESSRQQAKADATRSIGGLLHHIQLERTGSVTALVALDVPGAPLLETIRADLSEDVLGIGALREHQGVALGAEAVAALDHLNDRLSGLEATRRAVDDGLVSVIDTIEHFTGLGHDALAVLDVLCGDPDVVRYRARLIAAAALLRANELASVEQAVLGHVFHEDRFAHSELGWIMALVSGQETLLRIFRQSTTSEIRDELSAALQHPDAAHFQQLEGVAVINGVAGFGVDPTAWFAASTRRASNLESLESRQVEELHQLADSEAAESAEDASRSTDPALSSALERTMSVIGDIEARSPQTADGHFALRSLLSGEDDVTGGHHSGVAASIEAADGLAKLAGTDPLTGLPNRSMSTEIIQQALDRSPGVGSTVAVMMLDVDNFMLINDSMGHGVGDLLLQS
ncbi:MAG: nitrate- and nitrite sensing domain-containing protein, partial [Actinomycetota bacterium]|nr:nitrate- and nitrite sensing domain-containing protein [Actinomycetota bacterium]